MTKTWHLILMVLAALTGAVVFYLVSVVMDARTATPEWIAEIQRDTRVRLETLPEQWIEYIIQVEDPTFWENDGIDFRSPGQGLTTLTQGLAKRLYFARYTPGPEKLELMLLSKFALSEVVSKEDILEAFLNTAYLGGDESGSIIGFSEAAQRFYGAELLSLNDRQFLSLVAMLIAPNALHPTRNEQALNNRVERIEKLVAGECQPTGLTDVYLEGCA